MIIYTNLIIKMKWNGMELEKQSVKMENKLEEIVENKVQNDGVENTFGKNWYKSRGIKL